MNTLVNEIITEENISDKLFDKTFFEFCRDIKRVEYLLEDRTLFYEAVQDNNQTLKKTAGDIKAAANSLNAQSGGVYGNLTDAGGAMFKTAWTVCLQACSIGSRLIKFICERISLLPTYVGKVNGAITSIPKGVKSKITGDIKLYITAGDITNLYQTMIFSRIRQYLAYAQNLAKGDFWGTFFHRRKEEVDKTGMSIKQNDLKYCEEMHKLYQQLQNISFQQTTIPMKNRENIEMYFGNAGTCSFNDIDNKPFKGTYYQGLNKVLTDLNADKENLETVNKEILEKGTRTMKNNTFGNLSARQQVIVQTMLNETSKVTNIIANMVRCVMADMKEIENAVGVIRSVDGAVADPETIQSIQTTKDQAIAQRVQQYLQKQQNQTPGIK